ncbi:hypothetical protein OWV82_006681 [Melia azedarach]|uniref:Uncharacterized protein n=1 Tax=Melia azedarach TaxID=155640 RepID=A0ACC1YHK3_MELAZ|nr:hypothetical protein OWV82_006681 [Melia azedarach]
MGLQSEIEASDISSEFPSSPENKLTMTLASFSFSMALAQLSFPQQYMNGKPVPPSLFKQHPSMFEALVIFNMLSFTSSFSLLLIRNKPEFATLRKCYFLISTVSSALVTSLMTVALILASFNKVSSQINLWLNQFGAQS